MTEQAARQAAGWAGKQATTSEQLTVDVFNLFDKWIRQRAGLDPRNYFSDWRDRDGRWAYQQEARQIQADGRRARKALEQARMYPFDAAAMVEATGAFSGRLRLVAVGSAAAWTIQIDYCTGQYWPTEYRKAAATVLERYAEAVRPKMTPGGRVPGSMSELQAMNRAAGGHFFDRESMRCFRSRVVPQIWAGPGGVYFVTSEADSDAGERRFTVRMFDPAEGDVNTFGEFRAWSRGAAVGIARRAAAASPALCHVCGGEGRKYGQECWHCKGAGTGPGQAVAA